MTLYQSTTAQTNTGKASLSPGSGIDVLVLRDVGMSPFALREENPSIATQNIFSPRHRFEMRGVNADGNTAQVIERKIIRQIPSDQQVGVSVSEHFNQPVALLLDKEQPVTGTDFPSGPNPTRSKFGSRLRNRPMFINFGPETLFGRPSNYSHKRPFCLGITVLVDPCQVCGAHTPRPHFSIASGDGTHARSMAQ